MTTAARLWAIGYDNMGRAEEVRDEITRLAWDTGQAGKYLILLDIAVVVRHGDGSFTFDRKPFPGVANILACTAARSLVTRSSGRGWAVMAGVAALLLGLCVWLMLPVPGLWLVGLCIAVDFLCHGVSWSALALTERKHLHAAAP